MASADADTRFDLVLTRDVGLPREKIWQAWTEPKHLMPWFCPKPWQATECEIDLKPGGKFRTVMRGPNNELMDNVGCYLEVVPREKLTFTSVLGPGYRPIDRPMLSFTAVLTLEDIPGGTRYTVRALHGNELDARRHADMGFEQGWSRALDQLVEYMSART